MKRHVTACWATEPELPGKELCAFMDVCMRGYMYMCVYMYVWVYILYCGITVYHISFQCTAKFL